MSKSKITYHPHGQIQEMSKSEMQGKHNFADMKSRVTAQLPGDGAYGVPEYKIKSGSQQEMGRMPWARKK